MTQTEKNRQFKAVIKLFHCSEQQAKDIIAFSKNKVYTETVTKRAKLYNDLHLEQSLDATQKHIYYLFTKVAEKEVITEGFKILNEVDFSEIELEWLEKQYKFIAKSKFISVF